MPHAGEPLLDSNILRFVPWHNSARSICHYRSFAAVFPTSICHFLSPASDAPAGGNVVENHLKPGNLRHAELYVKQGVFAMFLRVCARQNRIFFRALSLVIRKALPAQFKAAASFITRSLSTHTSSTPARFTMSPPRLLTAISKIGPLQNFSELYIRSSRL
jgi:hypothetical protein